MLPSSVIKEYLHAKFPDNRIIGDEFTVDSIFTNDEKKHLSINMETGLWQDFKSSERGSFPQLVAYVEDIPYREALQFLRSKLFDTPELLFEISSVRENIQKPSSVNTIPDIFKSFERFDIDNIDQSSLTARLAKKFITDRKLESYPSPFYICQKGRYANRLIIPYAYKDRPPFYFQARNLSLLGTKYLNPSSAVTGAKSSDMLFPFRVDGDYVVVTEGPLDAISLQLHGLNATSTQGSTLSHAQAATLKNMQVIFAYDNDEAGKIGIKKARKLMLEKNRSQFCIAHLPSGVKDWNDVHVLADSNNHFRQIFKDGLHPMTLEYEVTEELG